MIDKYTYDKNEVIKENIKRFLKKTKRIIEFDGCYPTMNDAEVKTIGYDSQIIFKKAINAAWAVINGEAEYERDTVLFSDEEKYYELLYYLELAQKKLNRTKVSVIDYGGAFASMYFQHRKLIEESVLWTVIEQEHFAKYGKEHFENEGLKFEYSIDKVDNFDFVIFGSSLQYISSCEKIIEKVLTRKPHYVFVDRTPMSGENFYCVETVHEPIYEASYAFRVFKREEFENFFAAKGYRLVGSWKPNTGNEFRIKSHKVIFESMVWEKC